jgi:hypothetical protein
MLWKSYKPKNWTSTGRTPFGVKTIFMEFSAFCAQNNLILNLDSQEFMTQSNFEEHFFLNIDRSYILRRLCIFRSKWDSMSINTI